MQSLIDSFSNAEKSPHIAVSVDMLDTGIDIPEIERFHPRLGIERASRKA